MQVKQKVLSIIWVDEAGRGSWAGPVFAWAFVVLDPKATRTSWWKSLADSKILTAKKREELFISLHQAQKDGLVDFGIWQASSQEIDTIGIKPANRTAMLRAVQELISHHFTGATHLSIDGNDKYVFPELGENYTTEFIIRGDSKVKSISAASILAKVARDHAMIELAKIYPEYGFELHKWYGTKFHHTKLTIFWPTRDHRASYAPIKNLLSTPKDLYFWG